MVTLIPCKFFSILTLDPKNNFRLAPVPVLFRNQDHEHPLVGHYKS